MKEFNTTEACSQDHRGPFYYTGVAAAAAALVALAPAEARAESHSPADTVITVEEGSFLLDGIAVPATTTPLEVPDDTEKYTDTLTQDDSVSTKSSGEIETVPDDNSGSSDETGKDPVGSGSAVPDATPFSQESPSPVVSYIPSDTSEAESAGRTVETDYARPESPSTTEPEAETMNEQGNDRSNDDRKSESIASESSSVGDTIRDPDVKIPTTTDTPEKISDAATNQGGDTSSSESDTNESGSTPKQDNPISNSVASDLTEYTREAPKLAGDEVKETTTGKESIGFGVSPVLDYLPSDNSEAVSQTALPEQSEENVDTKKEESNDSESSVSPVLDYLPSDNSEAETSSDSPIEDDTNSTLPTGLPVPVKEPEPPVVPPVHETAAAPPPDAAAEAEIPPRPAAALPVQGRITSEFGPRWGDIHYGLDIAAPLGTELVAMRDGVVIEEEPASGFGFWIRIQHENGDVTVYGHMYGEDSKVKVGDVVTAGQPISLIGDNGLSTGPHVHVEVWKNGNRDTRVDPKQYMRELGVNI